MTGALSRPLRRGIDGPQAGDEDREGLKDRVGRSKGENTAPKVSRRHGRKIAPALGTARTCFVLPHRSTGRTSCTLRHRWPPLSSVLQTDLEGDLVALWCLAEICRTPKTTAVKDWRWRCAARGEWIVQPS